MNKEPNSGRRDGVWAPSHTPQGRVQRAWAAVGRDLHGSRSIGSVDNDAGGPSLPKKKLKTIERKLAKQINEAEGDSEVLSKLAYEKTTFIAHNLGAHAIESLYDENGKLNSFGKIASLYVGGAHTVEEFEPGIGWRSRKEYPRALDKSASSDYEGIALERKLSENRVHDRDVAHTMALAENPYRTEQIAASSSRQRRKLGKLAAKASNDILSKL